MHGRSPKGARKRDGLDVEAAGGMAEVQKEQETVVYWTLKLWEACGSPKGARNRGGLDVKAVGKQAEVQSGRVNPGRLYIMSKNKGDELKL